MDVINLPEDNEEDFNVLLYMSPPIERKSSVMSAFERSLCELRSAARL